MLSTTLRRMRGAALAAAAATAVVPLAGPAPALAADTAPALAPDTHFFTPVPDPDGLRQVADLTLHRDLRDAYLVGREETTPQAVWFTKGTPAEVQADVHRTVTLAAATHTVPTLVVYNVPGRDCSQYSSGGAGSDQAYRTWIDGVTAGLIPGQQITVVVEPDGLANLPSDCPGAYPGQDIPAITAGRIGDIAYAGRAIEAADSAALVYLDAGHSSWHNVGDITDRLVQAGVTEFEGISLDVSNYQWTPNLEQYGTWISDCIAFTTVQHGSSGDCGNQYWSGGPANDWTGTTLNGNLQWSDTATDPAANTAGINSRYASQLGTVKPTARFVIDTSRNGQGPWDPKVTPSPTDDAYPDPQTWCNPPDRGLGARPKAAPDPGFPLADAFLWVKTPGQSDGQCNRGIAGSTTDPEWGRSDPAAGDWFPQQALELAQLAGPPLR